MAIRMQAGRPATGRPAQVSPGARLLMGSFAAKWTGNNSLWSQRSGAGAAEPAPLGGARLRAPGARPHLAAACSDRLFLLQTAAGYRQAGGLARSPPAYHIVWQAACRLGANTVRFFGYRRPSGANCWLHKTTPSRRDNDTNLAS